MKFDKISAFIGFASVSALIACIAIDMEERAVYDAAIHAAYKAGIDILYLMDK